MCSTFFLRVASGWRDSRTDIRSNRRSDMHTDTAPDLPFPRHREERSGDAARAHVRLVLSRRGRAVLTAVAFVLGLLVAAAVLLLVALPALAGTEGEQAVSVTVEAGDTL